MITYFIQRGDSIKIGRTSNIQDRFAAIQTGSSKVLGLLKTCDNITESSAHLVASGLSTRLVGEWFAATPQLIDWIESLPQTKSPEGLMAIRKVGRPSGKTKEKISATLNFRVLKEAKRISDELGITLSEYIEKAVVSENSAMKPTLASTANTSEAQS